YRIHRTAYMQLRKIAIEKLVRYYYAPISWVEIIGKVYREANKLNINISKLIDAASDSIFKSGFYEYIQPSEKAIKLAFKLRAVGHKDIIDNLLYAIAITNDMIFLTMDEKFKRFLSEHKYDIKNLMDHTQLINLVRGKGR
ncbi:MAG: PIN domain-containing protein, partial [Candidatus Asgardarchaeum sp.]